MRVKVILSAACVALLILVPAIYFHFAPSAPPPDQTASAPEPVVTAPAPKSSPSPAVAHRRTVKPVDGGTGVQVPGSPGPDRDQYVSTRQADLAQLGMSDDPSDLKTILSELNNKEPAIRSAALSAAVQFGSQDAIPSLKNELQWADDPQEKVDIMNAIKYLELPSFQEYQANLAAAPVQPPNDQPSSNN